jgi:SAM-dependent methyltransferase
MNKNLEYWNRSIRERKDYSPKHDGWLDKYEEYINVDKDTTIIDLGIGWGNNADYFLKRKFRVEGCDFCPEAIKVMNELYPDVKVYFMDLREPLPWENLSTSVVLGDLSLHYFNYSDVNNILEEIKRILKPGGLLLCRVNSDKAKNYGMGEGEKLEENVYDTTSGIKMFFNEKMINNIFKDWKIIHCNEYTTGRFDKPKLIWEIAVQRI